MLSSSSSSSSSATARVDKATSDLLIGPDWTMNIDICDSINSNHWDAKDVVRAVKKRLLHKNPKVQLLALTLLETMVKNCGDYVHFQIVERNILQEMIKIVRKKADMHVRDKILVLLDSWQEAFGGQGGKYPQYYWAYEELRRTGVRFPQRSLDASPIFTPPAVHPTQRQSQAGYGMPSNSSTRLDEAMAAEVETLSLSSINSMRDVLDLLGDMLQAVNPSDRAAVKDEVIADLVVQCRSNQKKLMQMLTTTGDEELLAQGLELNDSMQTVLAKHDAIASGSPLPTHVTSFNSRSTEELNSSPNKPMEVREPGPSTSTSPSVSVVTTARSQLEEEEEEEEDDFAQLARRHSKTQPTAQSTSNGTTSSPTAPVFGNELAVVDPPAPARSTKEQDMIDLLSLTLTTTTMESDTPQSPAASTQNVHHTPVSPTTQNNPYASPVYHGSQGQLPFSHYVAPWAQPPSQAQPQPQPQRPLHPQSHPQPQYPLHSQPHPQPQPQRPLHPQSQPQPQYPLHSQPQPQRPLHPQRQPQTQSPLHRQPQPQTQHPQHPQPQHQPIPHPQPRHVTQPQAQPVAQSHHTQYPSGYIPPPWATTPGYFNNQSSSSTPYSSYMTPQTNTSLSYMPVQGGARPLQQLNSFPSTSNGPAMDGNARFSGGPRPAAPATTGQKPFVPSYRLFEDLNVLGSGEGGYKGTSSSSSSLSGTSNQSMVGGRK